MRGKRWTPELIEQLRALYADPSLRCRDIGARMGFSEYAIRHAAHKLSLPNRTNMYLQSPVGREFHRVAQREKSRHTSDKIARIQEMWANGVSASGIGKLLGETKNVIIGLRRRHGIDGRPNVINAPWNEDEDAILRAGVGDGLSHKEIAMRLPRRTDKAVRNRCAFLGLSEDYRKRQELRRRHRPKRRRAVPEGERSQSGDNLIVVNLGRKRVVAKVPPPLRSIVCESVPLEPDHRGCQWVTSDGRPWMVCANRRDGGRSYCRAHYELSIGGYEPDEPDEAAPEPMREAA